MGCISSKEIARSMSIREEFNHGFQSRAVAWEDLLTSSNHAGKDHQLLIAFLSSSTNKRRTISSNTLPTPDLETTTTTLQDLIPQSELSLNQDEYKDLNFSKFTRSKSSHTLRDTEVLYSSNENNTGSRSFHTVEEYDALLERIHHKGESFEDYLSSIRSVKLQPSKSFVGYKNANKTKEELEDMEHEKEIGWKRKAVAKELKSLDVSNIEFPVISRQRQLVQMDGSYTTPKFGSYNSRVTGEEEEEDRENPVFCSELVSAFEDCMQQLQLEEENILSYINGDQTSEESNL